MKWLHLTTINQKNVEENHEIMGTYVNEGKAPCKRHSYLGQATDKR
jgi:hypothetical protein